MYLSNFRDAEKYSHTALGHTTFPLLFSSIPLCERQIPQKKPLSFVFSFSLVSRVNILVLVRYVTVSPRQSQSHNIPHFECDNLAAGVQDTKQETKWDSEEMHLNTSIVPVFICSSHFAAKLTDSQFI
jgi:hypothetical protein